MKAVKVNSAEWLPTIGKEIEDFCKKIKLPGLHGPNLFAHIAYHVVQRGGDVAEFYVVFDKDIPIAFAEWMLLDIPHVAKAYMPYIHTWQKPRECFDLLLNEFLKFGERHRVVWYSYDPMNKKLYNILEIQLKKRGHKLIPSGVIHCISRRQEP